jgi:hypothetical protein
VVLLAVSALPAFGQDKEQDRVENAGKVVQEIMNIPDDIPQSCDRQSGVCCGFAFRDQVCRRNWRKLRPGRDDLPSR